MKILRPLIDVYQRIICLHWFFPIEKLMDRPLEHVGEKNSQ